MVVRAIIALALLGLLPAGRATASCSSRDGQNYCTCTYTQHCTSTEDTCHCELGIIVIPGDPAPERSPARRSSMPTTIEAPNNFGQRPIQEILQELKISQSARSLQAATMPDTKPASSDADQSAHDYIARALVAISKGNVHTAVELIDQGETRLLDRSVTLNQTFAPITDQAIQSLSDAKQLLLAHDRTKAAQILDSVLTSIN